MRISKNRPSRAEYKAACDKRDDMLGVLQRRFNELAEKTAHCRLGIDLDTGFPPESCRYPDYRTQLDTARRERDEARVLAATLDAKLEQVRLVTTPDGLVLVKPESTPVPYDAQCGAVGPNGDRCILIGGHSEDMHRAVGGNGWGPVHRD